MCLCVVGPRNKSLKCLFTDNQDVDSHVGGVCVLLDSATSHYTVFSDNHDVDSRVSCVCVLLDPATSQYTVYLQTIKMLVAVLVVFVCC